MTALKPQTKHEYRLFANLITHALHIGRVRTLILSTMSLGLYIKLVDDSYKGDASQEYKARQHSVLFGAQPKLFKHFYRLQSKRGELPYHEISYIWDQLDYIMKLIEGTDSAGTPVAKEEDQETVLLFLSLLVDCMSQVPTRRFLRVVLSYGMHLIVRCRLQYRRFDKRFGLLVSLLQRLVEFPINEASNTPMSLSEREAHSSDKLISLYRIAFKFFPEKLKDLSLSNLSRIRDGDVLRSALDYLEDVELQRLAVLLGLFITSEFAYDRNFLIEIIVSNVLPFGNPESSLDEELIVSPTEKDLWNGEQDASSLYTSCRRLQLTSLSIDDYIYRHFELFKRYQVLSLRSMLEDIVPYTQPSFDSKKHKTKFMSSHQDAVAITSCRIEHIGTPLVGETVPSKVTGKIRISLKKLKGATLHSWADDWRRDDYLILLCVYPKQSKRASSEEDYRPFNEKYGIKFVRIGRVLDVKDFKGNDVMHTEHSITVGFERFITVQFDRYQYALDRINVVRTQDHYSDPYRYLNLAVKVSRDNTHGFVLEALRNLFGAEEQVNKLWINDLFLGFQPPEMTDEVADGSYSRYFTVAFGDKLFANGTKQAVAALGDVASNVVEGENNPSVKIIGNGNAIKIHFPLTNESGDEMEEDEDASSSARQTIIEGYTAADSTDAPSSPLTTEYLHAIIYVMKTKFGVSLIDSVPSTRGVVNVATSVLSLFAKQGERTLVLSGNQVLLDELQYRLFTDTNGISEDQRGLFTVLGREQQYIDALLQRRLDLLNKVSKALELAANQLTCESALFYLRTSIRPLWDAFMTKYASSSASTEIDATSFPQVLRGFLEQGEQAPSTIAKAQNFFARIETLFEEIERLRSLELIRSFKGRKQHLLSNFTRIVSAQMDQAIKSLYSNVDKQALYGSFNNIIVLDSHVQFEASLFVVLNAFAAQRSQFKRLVLFGDSRQSGRAPGELLLEGNSKHIARLLCNEYNLYGTVFDRFAKLKLGTVTPLLDVQSDEYSKQMTALWRPLYGLPLSVSTTTTTTTTVTSEDPIFGLKHAFYFIDVEPKFGNVENPPNMNLGEAEFVVQLYMLLRLQGCAQNEIAIISLTHAQYRLIRDVLERRCSKNPLFGEPTVLLSLSDFHAYRSKIVLVSMVHTENKFGVLQDPRLLCSLLSCASSALYLLGKLSHWSSYPLLPEHILYLIQARGAELVLQDDTHITGGLKQLGENVKTLAYTKVHELQQYQYEWLAKMRVINYQRQQYLEQEQYLHKALTAGVSQPAYAAVHQVADEEEEGYEPTNVPSNQREEEGGEAESESDEDEETEEPEEASVEQDMDESDE